MQVTHLSTLKGVKLGVVRCADDLCVRPVGGSARDGLYSKPGFAFLVADGVVLPREECLAVERSLEDPVAGSRRDARLDYHVSDLEHLPTIN